MVANRDYVLMIDKSGSMSATDCGGKSRWKAAEEATFGLAHKVAPLDPDGITVYTFAGGFKRYDGVTPDRVAQIFREEEPFGGTATDKVLAEEFKHWEDRKKKGELKDGTTILVITDGQPNDANAVARVIKDVTQKMDADPELAISFLQVGKDIEAKAFLDWLDDGLEAEGAKFDIVDTKTFDEIEAGNLTLTEVLAAAIED